MSFEQIRQKADRLRAIPLPSVLRLWGARRDRHDKCKWHTSRGILSVTGAKFSNWNCGGGGGGAIDLAIHLHNDCRFREALDWLDRNFPFSADPPFEEQSRPAKSGLFLPAPDPTQLGRVQTYLKTQRSIAPALIAPLIDSGTLYADQRGNAVFLLLGAGKHASASGAELRGTTSTHWRGMAPGSRKNLGFFSIPTQIDSTEAQGDLRPIILCESAIDAISCFALHPGHCCCLSTSGARPNPAWLAPLIAQGRPIYCGFDADHTGDRMAQAMIALHPEVERLRPARNDWNDLLKARA